jgi:hypothetical protein
MSERLLAPVVPDQKAEKLRLKSEISLEVLLSAWVRPMIAESTIPHLIWVESALGIISPLSPKVERCSTA